MKRQAEILKKKSNNIANYTLRSALRDLLEMHQEGSLVSALASLQRTTGDAQKAATTAFDEAKKQSETTLIKQ